MKTKKKEIAEESAEVESIKKQIQDLKKNITSLICPTGYGYGGAVNIRDMDDVDRSTALVNGKFLKYNSTTGKFVGADATERVMSYDIRQLWDTRTRNRDNC